MEGRSTTEEGATKSPETRLVLDPPDSTQGASTVLTFAALNLFGGNPLRLHRMHLQSCGLEGNHWRQ